MTVPARPPIAAPRRTLAATPLRAGRNACAALASHPNRLVLAATMIVTSAALLASPAPARAGAWTREPGAWFLKLGYDRLLTDQRFDSTGERVDYLETEPGFDDEDEYRTQALRAYVEYGVADGWTLIGSGAHEWVESEGNGVLERNSGFSDVTLQLKRRLLDGPIVVSVLAEGKFPTGYESTRSPALGTGATDAGARLAAGGSRDRFYATAEAGYLIRGGGHSDQVPFAFEAGYALPSMIVKGEIRGVTTARLATGPGRFDPALADSRHVTGGLAVGLRGAPLDLVFGFDRLLAGKNSLAGARLSFSVWYASTAEP